MPHGRDSLSRDFNDFVSKAVRHAVYKVLLRSNPGLNGALIDRLLIKGAAVSETLPAIQRQKDARV